MPLESATYVNDFNALYPEYLDQKHQGDDHIRLVKSALKATFPGMAGRMSRVVTASGSSGLTTTQNTVLVRATATLTLTLSAAATYGNGFMVFLAATGGDITVTPNGAELVNGTNTAIVVTTGNMAALFCDGTSWYMMVSPAVTSQTVSAISGNTTLDGADFSRVRTITASADVTLPTTANSRPNGIIRLKSYSTGNVRVLRNSGQTIDNTAADVRLPAYELIELMFNGGDWIITRKPTSYVGEVRAMCNATPELGWAAVGTAISRTTFAGLFAVCGTTYGPGDGSTTFDPPDGRGRVLVGAGTGTQVLVTTGATASANAVPIASNDAWHTGMFVTTSNVSGFSGGLSNSTYYIRRISATSVKFYTTLAAALQDGTPVTITGTGNVTMTHTLTARAAGEKFGHEARGQHANEVGTHQHTDSFTNPGGGGIGYDGNGGGADVNFTSAWATTETMSTKPPSLGIPMMVKL